MQDTKWKKLLISLLVAAASIAAYRIILSTKVIEAMNLGSNATSFLKELVMFICFFAAALILKRVYVLKFKSKGFGIGFLIGIIPLLMCLDAVKTLITNYQTYGTCMTISVAELLMFILLNLMIGMAEELLFRGIVQNSLHEFFGEKSQGAIRAAIIIQAILFASIHFLNLTSTSASFASVLIQVILNIGMGAILGTMYYRSDKNLWVCIILHALNDFRAFVSSGALVGVDTADNISSYDSEGSEAFLSVIVFAAVYLAIMLFATRKKALAKHYN